MILAVHGLTVYDAAIMRWFGRGLSLPNGVRKTYDLVLDEPLVNAHKYLQTHGTDRFYIERTALVKNLQASKKSTEHATHEPE